MKKFVLLCGLALICGLCACNKIPDDPTTLPTTAPSVETTAATTAPTTVPPTEPTVPATTEPVETTVGDTVFSFPKDFSVLGVDLSGLTAEEGYASLCEGLADYELRITVNGTDIRVSGKTLGLTYSEEAFLAAAEAMAAGQGGNFDEPLSYSSSALRKALSGKLDRSVSNAYLRYNSFRAVFEIRPEKNGQTTDLSAVLKKADAQILVLGGGFSMDAPVTPIPASVTADSAAAQAALKKANAMLEVSLSYTYAPAGESAKTETLTRSQLASFITFDSGLNVTLDTEAASDYAWEMNKKYQAGGGTGKFRTTYGGTVNLMVEYMGRGIDTDALVEDIWHCMENGISGTRQARYLDASVTSNMPYNGTYIEVNLSAQHMWFYKNGRLLVESPIVSGCVSKGWTTPNGVFSIYQKFTDSYISGGTAYVHCFMAYNGNYGLHDATWRDSFGGDIYLTDGSHGCTNMPKNEALTVYRNAPLGTMVILYGGATSVDLIQQQITGTDAYRIASDSAPFVLDAAAVQPLQQPMRYVSSDPAVVEVAQDGTVTIRGEGKAQITVSTEAFSNVTAAEKIIQVEIYSPCLDGRHSYGAWEMTKTPSCVAGEETAACACGDKQTRPVEPVSEHNYENWTVTREPSCEEGEETGTCVCGDTKTRPVAPAAEHTPGQWTVSTEPTCGAAGEETTTCTVCHGVLTRPVEGLEHSFASGGETCDRGCGTPNPEYKPPEETQPETEPETQPETEPETQPETEPETQPEIEPETQPETEPETTPAQETTE